MITIKNKIDNLPSQDYMNSYLKTNYIRLNKHGRAIVKKSIVALKTTKRISQLQYDDAMKVIGELENAETNKK